MLKLRYAQLLLVQDLFQLRCIPISGSETWKPACSGILRFEDFKFEDFKFEDFKT